MFGRTVEFGQTDRNESCWMTESVSFPEPGPLFGCRESSAAGVCGTKTELRELCRVRQKSERSEEHTSELQSRLHLVCRLLLEKKKANQHTGNTTPPDQCAVDRRVRARWPPPWSAPCGSRRSPQTVHLGAASG